MCQIFEISIYYHSGSLDDTLLQLGSHERMTFSAGAADWSQIVVDELGRQPAMGRASIGQTWVHQSAFVGGECRTLVAGQCYHLSVSDYHEALMEAVSATKPIRSCLQAVVCAHVDENVTWRELDY